MINIAFLGVQVCLGGKHIQGGANLAQGSIPQADADCSQSRMYLMIEAYFGKKAQVHTK